MLKGNTKLFTHDKGKFYQMVNLRIIGVATSSLGLLFNCDRSSIESQLDKYFINPKEQIYTIERIVSNALPESKEDNRWIDMGERKINRGKTYAEYQADKYPHRSFSKRIYT